MLTQPLSLSRCVCLSSNSKYISSYLSKKNKNQIASICLENEIKEIIIISKWYREWIDNWCRVHLKKSLANREKIVFG
jgi:hypothetical protein